MFGSLDATQEYAPENRNPNSAIPWVLDTDVIWSTDLLMERGTFNSYIRLYANNDPSGNLGTQPYVFYEQDYIFNPGSYRTMEDATVMAVKYVSASAIQISGTDYWNYRIFFDMQQYCTPRKGKIFPAIWYIRGG